MVYRESARIRREIVLSAEKAILDLHHEFSGLWDVTPETLLRHLEEIAREGGHGSHNHILHTLRMLVRNGHDCDALKAAIKALRESGAFVPAEQASRAFNPFANEIVETEWDYPAGYTPPNFREQITALQRFFPELVQCAHPPKMPRAVEGFHPIVVPKLSSLARLWSVWNPYERGYEVVIRHLADAVQETYRARRSGFAKTSLDLKGFMKIAPCEHSSRVLMRLESENPHSHLIAFPGQLGIRWAGSSMRRVRWHCAETDYEPDRGFEEFVLPSYIVMIQLLLCPERLLSVSSLYMFCAGDDAVKRSFFGHNGVGFAFGSGVLHFMDCSQSSPDKMYGVPTGLAPK